MATYTLTPADAGDETRVTNANPSTIIAIPTDLAQPGIVPGMVFIISRISAGTVTISPTGGVTLNTSASLSLANVGDTVRLIKVGANEWDMAAWGASGGGAANFNFKNALVNNQFIYATPTFNSPTVYSNYKITTQGPVAVTGNLTFDGSSSNFQSYSVGFTGQYPVSTGLAFGFTVERQPGSIGIQFNAQIILANGNNLVVAYQTHSANPSYYNALQISGTSPAYFEQPIILFPTDTTSVDFNLVISGTNTLLFYINSVLHATLVLSGDWSTPDNIISSLGVTSATTAGGGTGPGSPGPTPATFTEMHINGNIITPTSYQIDASPTHDTIGFPNLLVTPAGGGFPLYVTQQALDINDHGNFILEYPLTNALSFTPSINFNTGFTVTQSGGVGQQIKIDANIIESVTLNFGGA